MLALKNECEICKKALPHDSSEAMICSYECTFCIDCAENTLQGICPNCGGNLENRPTRIKK